MTNSKWLPKWELVPIFLEASPYVMYYEECSAMRVIGEKLSPLGVLPDFKGVDIAEIHRLGTSGNFAARVRITKNRHVIAVTSRGSHKGKLQENHFVAIHEIDWRRRQIFAHIPAPNIQPSTDTLLTALAFKASPSVGAWVHCHRPLPTAHKLKLAYPAISQADMNVFRTMVKSGARVINLIGHDPQRNGGRDDLEDAAIVLGEDIAETGELAINLIHQSLRERRG